MKFDRQLRPTTETSWVISYGGKTIPRWRTAAILKIDISAYLSEKSYIGFSWNFVHSSRFWTGLTSRDQKWKSWIGQTPSSTERISCFFDRVQKYRKIRQAGMYKYDSAKMSWMHSCHSQSFRQVWYKSAVDCMRNANKCPKIPYSAMVKKIKKWSGIHTRIRIATKS